MTRQPGASRRQEMLDQAVLLMKEKGFTGTSIREITGHFGLSKANFYHHIRNKEEMLYQISSKTLSYTLEKVQAIVIADAGPPERMHAIVECFVNLVAEHHALISVYFEERRHLRPAHIREMAKLEREIFESVVHLYRDGVVAGYFRDDIDPGLAVWGTLGMCFWMTKWYKRDGHLSRDFISQQLNTLLSRGCFSRLEGRRHPSAPADAQSKSGSFPSPSAKF